MGAIVRVIWGGPVKGRPDERWEKIWDDVQACKEREDPGSFLVYVYGKENQKRLKGMGVSYVWMVDERPYPRWMDHHRQSDGWIARPWRYKMELIRRAIHDHYRIIFCDWDVHRHVDADVAFAAIDDRPYLLTLMRYRYAQDLWGPTQHRSPGERMMHPQCLCVSGCWMYLRGTDWIDEVLRRMPTEPVDRVDNEEIAMTHQIRDQHGGKWPGEQTWLRRYESPIMMMRYHSPWKLGEETEVEDGLDYYETKTAVPFRWTKMFSLYP